MTQKQINNIYSVTFISLFIYLFMVRLPVLLVTIQGDAKDDILKN